MCSILEPIPVIFGNATNDTIKDSGEMEGSDFSIPVS